MEGGSNWILRRVVGCANVKDNFEWVNDRTGYFFFHESCSLLSKFSKMTNHA